jgi:hypothetical protein
MEPLASRRDLLLTGLACSCSTFLYAQEARAEETPRDVALERAAPGTPHKGKVLLAVQQRCDGRPQLHPRIHPRAPSRSRPKTRLPVCGGVPLHRGRRRPLGGGRIHQDQRDSGAMNPHNGIK